MKPLMIASVLKIKKERKEQIESLEEQLSKDGSDTKKVNIEKFLDRALQSIVNIPRLCREGEINTKEHLLVRYFLKNWNLTESLSNHQNERNRKLYLLDKQRITPKTEEDKRK